jgi:hypothetical protein
MKYLLKLFESVQNAQSTFRMFSNVQILFNQCSECLVMFRLCSVNVQNVQDLVRIYCRVQNVQNQFSQCYECSAMFRLFSECSVMFRLCSEYLAQKLVCSEFLDFAVYFEIRCFQSGSMNECPQSLPIAVWSNTHNNILRNLEFGVCFHKMFSYSCSEKIHNPF